MVRDAGFAHVAPAGSRECEQLLLEIVVFLSNCPFQKDGSNPGYVRTGEGHEVDFLARDTDGAQTLIQVCADMFDEKTCDREVRALVEASKEYPKATQTLVTLEPVPPDREIPKGINWQSASEWLLGE